MDPITLATALATVLTSKLAKRVYEWIKEHPRSVYPILAFEMIVGVAFVWVAYTGLTYIGPRLPEFFDDFRHHPGVFAGLTMLLGALFYLLRLKRRIIYAMLEFAVGIALAIKALDTPLVGFQDSILATATLLSAVYIHVRGFDNFIEGYKKGVEKTKPALNS